MAKKKDASSADPASQRWIEELVANQAKAGFALATIAKLITPGPPKWLVEFLERWASSVTIDSAVQAKQPTRAEMVESLKGVAGGATVLIRALQDAGLREFLDAAGATPISDNLIPALRDIETRAAKASRQPSLVGPNGKPKAGRGRAKLDGTISARIFCALVIVEAWRHINGGYPAPRNKNAAKAADLYWKVAGGHRPEGWGNDTLAAWRPNLKEAETIEAEPWRTEIQRHLREWEHRASLLNPKADQGN